MLEFVRGKGWIEEAENDNIVAFSPEFTDSANRHFRVVIKKRPSPSDLCRQTGMDAQYWESVKLWKSHAWLISYLEEDPEEYKEGAPGLLWVVKEFLDV